MCNIIVRFTILFMQVVVLTSRLPRKTIRVICRQLLHQRPDEQCNYLRTCVCPGSTNPYDRRWKISSNQIFQSRVIVKNPTRHIGHTGRMQLYVSNTGYHTTILQCRVDSVPIYILKQCFFYIYIYYIQHTRA